MDFIWDLGGIFEVLDSAFLFLWRGASGNLERVGLKGCSGEMK